MSKKFFMPTLSLMGEGCLEQLKAEITSLGFKKALIVTDKNLYEVKLTDHITELLNEIEVEYAVYSEVKPNPTVSNVEDGIKVFTDNKCDFVISFGGGSSHDAAKAIALVLENGGKIEDYEGVDKSAKMQKPLIAINTTAGTASEMTVFTIITDEKRHVKMTIVDKHIIPIIAVNDPLVMHAMPKGLTAATGMDALTHAIEAYVSTAATPVTDACAQKAIELIASSLEDAVADGTDNLARENMAYAEYLAGMAFSNASLGYVHAMAHQLGGFYDLPHGVCNAVLLPHVQNFNKKVCAERLGDVARFIGIDTTGMDHLQAADSAIEYIKQLNSRIGIVSGLAELGVNESDFNTLTENALKDACGLTNPIQPTFAEVVSLFKAAM